MQYLHRGSLFSVIFLVVVALAGCGDGYGDGDWGGENVISSTRKTSLLEITLTSVKTVRQGDLVPITLSVKNISGETVTAMLGGGPGAISLASQGNTVVWSSVTGKAFPPVTPSPRSMAPNEQWEYDLSWDQTTDDGGPVDRGIYILHGWFNTSDLNGMAVIPSVDLAPEPIQIVIE